MRPSRIPALATLFALLAQVAAADVALDPLFGDNMVLQRDTKVFLWGTARPREKVTVKFEKETVTTRAGPDGKWRVEMGPFGINEGAKLTASARNKVTLTNVCVGEVWICSGQSNMNLPAMRAANWEKEAKRAGDPLLRLFTVPVRVSESPKASLAKGSWEMATPKTVQTFSAVAYYFGRQLRRDFGVPIGLVHASVGGTPAEAWTRHAALATDGTLKPILDHWDQLLAEYPDKLQKYKNALSDWQRRAAAERKQGRPPPRNRPQPPVGPQHPSRASGLWNGMIAPLVPLAMRGVIWYQGESNAGRAHQYRTLFPAMIQDWRRSWGRGDFPFLFVQLPNYRPITGRVVPSQWAELRDAQRFALKEPNTAMAVTIDIGSAWDIHPTNKQEVGRRLALIAKTDVYGSTSVVSRGPRYRDFSVDGPHFVLRFDHAEGGLRTRDDDPLRGFIIAGKDKRFRWAYARIDGDRVLVWHPLIRRPAAVRYAWADNPIANLINAAGLPAGPFRTDDWPISTAANR